MTTDFQSLQTLSWLGSAFLIAATAGIPLAGRLTDIFGRKSGAVLCNIVFTIGTLLCGIAPSEWVLILGRVLAGLGAGPLRTISSFVSSDLVPTKKRGLVQGLNLLCMGAGTALGGSFGGWMNSLLGWRWAFLIQVPFLVVGTILVYLFVDTPRKHSSVPPLRRIDWLGSITLVISLVLLLVGLNAGGNLVPWSHPLILLTTPLSVLALLVFLYNEQSWASEPILPLRLFKNRTFSASYLTYLFAHVAAFGIIYFIPVYAQIQGYSSVHAGLQFIPQAAGNATGALLAGALIRRTGKYLFLNGISQLCLVLAATLLSLLPHGAPSWRPFAYLALHGFGFGIMLVVAFIALLSAIPHYDQAVGTSALIALGSAGSALGVTICSAIFQNVLRKELYSLLGSSDVAEDIITRLRESFGVIPYIDPSVRPLVEKSFMAAVHSVFSFTLAVNIITLVSALFIRQNTLYNNLARPEESD
ncbi:MFS general substrate transporter [Aaosphaeria arxii CBS 175.79]|uniref:MFS general substrate transporter n=1 Tax=Aaosphaeria arxii CBS 175.79 TaxID=1450172 RepID=A0A6A5XKH3_9PLEO|nr:MFS general substrate transporter [Aaosphaeria arxii CBS 175.79]KAF2012804.1 MFS general substrate transporter [Aaosphaeria arxii CBS 175.79]